MGGLILNDIISGPLSCDEQNSYLKILIRRVCGMVGMEAGLVALQSRLTIENGTSTFNFQSNGFFFSFLRQQMSILKFLSDALQ